MSVYTHVYICIYMYTKIAVVFHHYSVRNNIFLTFFEQPKALKLLGMEVGNLWQILMSFPSLTNINFIQIMLKITVMKAWIVFFIQKTCLHKGQIKKHLIKVQEIAKEKEISVPAMDLFGFLLNKNYTKCFSLAGQAEFQSHSILVQNVFREIKDLQRMMQKFLYRPKVSQFIGTLGYPNVSRGSYFQGFYFMQPLPFFHP